MATATSSRRLSALALAAALAVAGCGATSGGAGHAPPDAFSWLQPAQPPAGWQADRLPSGAAELASPPGWSRIRTDPGTVSRALLGPRRDIRGYLNATPLSGAETLANWGRFRPAHNHEEGDRGVVTDATATHLRFRAATGSCVVDHYATTTSARYREIACLVRGSRATTVVVAAARQEDWHRLEPALRRSVASFST